MKQLAIIASLVLSSISAVAGVPGSNIIGGSIAHPLSFLYTSLQNVSIEKSQFQDLEVSGANVYISKFNKTITLEVHHQLPCHINFACRKFIVAPTVIDLPLVSVKKGECNSTIYIAELDLRPVDGPLSTIKVTDNSVLTCKPVEVADVTVSYQTEINSLTGESSNLTSTFQGAALKLTFPGIDPVF